MRTPITIETSEYLNAHGKKPRGRGSWAFRIIDGSCNSEVAVVFTPSMCFTEARIWIKLHIRDTYPEELATGFLRVQCGS